MTDKHVSIRLASLALPALVLLGYGWFIATLYRPYLDWNLRLRSPDLAGLPEDVIGWGFWIWWPVMAALFGLALAVTLWAVRRRTCVAISFLSLFAVLSIVDYLLCERLVQELLRPV
jgi:hypothetical protein